MTWTNRSVVCLCLLVAACSSSSGDLADGRNITIDGHVATIDAHVTAVDSNPSAPVDAPIAHADASPPDAQPAVCGNGVVETGEQCDDGNDNNFDACSNDCIAATGIILVSDSTAGVQGNEAPQSDDFVTISGDGNVVGFSSGASNLVPGDNNATEDVFIHDVATGVTTCVSVTPDGVPGNDFSTQPSLNADGRFIAFVSNANNLGPTDTNTMQDIYLRDTMLNTTTLVSVNDDGVIGDNYSYQPWISADGRYVVFGSAADNLTSDVTNGNENIFMRDTMLNTTTLISQSTDGVIGNGYSYTSMISASGRYVVFFTYANNFVPNDTNGHADVFVRDTMLNTTTMVSVNDLGVEGNDESQAAIISDDGRFVAFNSYATNLVPNDDNDATDMFMRDLLLGTTTLVTVTPNGTQADQGSDSLAMSSDGRFVLLATFADNLTPNVTPGRWNITVHDMRTGVNTLVSANAAGIEGNDQAGIFPAISANGQFIAFSSDASNLVPGDTNSGTDEFRTSLFPQQGILALADGLDTSSTGESVDISVELGTQPTADVTVALSVSNSDEASLSTPSLTFTSDNWNVPQTVTVTGLHDINANGDVAFTVDFANANSADPIYSGFVTPSIALINQQ